MNSKYEAEREYIQAEIRSGLRLDRDPEQVETLLSSMGLPTEAEQMVVAGSTLDPRRIAWARSPVKSMVEITLALGALGVLGARVSELSEKNGWSALRKYHL